MTKEDGGWEMKEEDEAILHRSGRRNGDSQGTILL